MSAAGRSVLHPACCAADCSVLYPADASLVPALVDALRAASLTVSCAESCTGGLVAKRITDVPGASSVFQGAIVSYANTVKTRVLGVPARVLQAHGAVSVETAVYMAHGAARCMDSDLAVGITGIAGPGGGSAEKPVGTVAIAWFCRGVTRAQLLHFHGGRDEIRRTAADCALRGLLRHALAFSV